MTAICYICLRAHLTTDSVVQTEGYWHQWLFEQALLCRIRFAPH